MVTLSHHAIVGNRISKFAFIVLFPPFLVVTVRDPIIPFPHEAFDLLESYPKSYNAFAVDPGAPWPCGRAGAAIFNSRIFNVHWIVSYASQI